MYDWRKKASEGIRTGTVFSFKRTFTETDTDIFGDITRDYNPVHYDTRFAGGKGFPSLISHGLLIGSMICEIGGQIAWLASGMSFKFIKPVYSGDTITCTMTVVSVDEKCRARADVEFINQNGERVMTAHITGYLPNDTDKENLSRMMEEGDFTNKLSKK